MVDGDLCRRRVSCTAWPLSRKGQLLHKGSNIKKGQFSCRSARPSISLEKRKETRKTARLQRLNLCPSAGPVFADRPRPTSPSVLTNPGGQVVRASSFQLQRRSSYWRLGPPVAAAAQRGRAVQSTSRTGTGTGRRHRRYLGPCTLVPPYPRAFPSFLPPPTPPDQPPA